MTNGKKVVQCVPNFSEGRDLRKIDAILEVFRGKEEVKLLDYNCNKSYNRTVAVVIGEPKKVAEAMLEAMERAVFLIDMRVHEGQYPRMGALDVVPFIPIRNMSMLEAIKISRDFAKKAGKKFNIPIFLYGNSATRPERQDICEIRKSEYEGMAQKIKRPEWEPDFGPKVINVTAGVTGVGARMPYVGLLINLDTKDKIIGKNIARSINFADGGLRFCRAISLYREDKEKIQIVIDLTNFNNTNLYSVFEIIKFEIKRYGISIVDTEISGIVSMDVLIDTAVYYLQINNFSRDKILENRLME
ncbi:glutamate formimidoyltransferase [Clostridium rectalis]|uniref:glutamate formimidoyltransferase n=1 Tax=Clostridium rectalis TaxID=2040295 RepID=UPI000F62E086|nr:glutamate formimidoyltransferase [Clostridium rectalis]